MDLLNEEKKCNIDKISDINSKISEKESIVHSLNLEIRKLKSKKRKIITKSKNKSKNYDDLTNTILKKYFENQKSKYTSNISTSHIVNHILDSMKKSKINSIVHRQDYYSESSDEEIGF